MARIKISKVARDLNVALPTVVEFLRGKNITVEEDNPNARIDEEVADLLIKEFESDKNQKNKSQELTNTRVKPKAAPAPKPAPAPAPSGEIKVESQINRPKILGKIELDRHGNPVRPKPEVPEAPKAPAAPAAEEPAADADVAPAK